MNTTTNQDEIEKRIHRFRASKSPWKTFSKTIADHLGPTKRVKTSTGAGITYEQLDWNHTDSMIHPRFQKAL